MVGGKAFGDRAQECVADVCGDVGTVRRIKPSYVSGSRAFRFWWFGFEIELVVVPAFLEGFLVRWDS